MALQRSPKMFAIRLLRKTANGSSILSTPATLEGVNDEDEKAIDSGHCHRHGR